MYGMTGLVVDVQDRASQVDVLQQLADAGVNLDLINVTQYRLYAILSTVSFHEKGEQLLSKLGFAYQVTHECAKLSIVGTGMRGTPGVMSRVIGCLHRAGVTVVHSTDSNITISILVRDSDVPMAVEALHQEFQKSTLV